MISPKPSPSNPPTISEVVEELRIIAARDETSPLNRSMLNDAADLISSLQERIGKLEGALHQIDIIAGNTIPRDGKAAGFAALDEITRLINPFRKARSTLTERGRT